MLAALIAGMLMLSTPSYSAEARKSTNMPRMKANYRTKSKPGGPDADVWAEIQKERQLHLLARLLYGENRNIDPQEALMMGDTVLNRMERKEWPSDMEGVLNQPNQYHPFNPKDPNFNVISDFAPGHPEWDRYYALAQEVMKPDRKRSDVTHYSVGTPDFEVEPRGEAGAHKFFHEPPAARRRKAQ